MSERLGLDHISLTSGGATLSMGISSGQSVAIVGPSGSGKSFMLNVLAGRERLAQGSIVRSGEHYLAIEGELSRRAKPLTLARRTQAQNIASAATEVLMATRLWEVRNEPVTNLSSGQIAACELLEMFVSDAKILLLDGQLDRLDPWTLKSVMDHLNTLMSRGACVVVATNRPDLVAQFDAVVVLRDRQVRFAGSIEDLIRNGPPHTLKVATENQPGVRALVEPFDVRVEQTADGMIMEAKEGQEIAAKLLAEGYGDVRFVIHRPPTVEEAILSLT